MPVKKSHHFMMALIYLISSIIILAAYSDLSKNWVSIGGSKSHHSTFEIPFALTILFILYFPTIKNKIIKYIFPSIPVITLYLFYDIFYNFFARSPRISDFQNFHTLFNFSNEIAFGSLSLAALIPISIYFLIRNAAIGTSWKSFKYSLFFRLSLLISLLYFLSTPIFTSWHNKNFVYTIWSPKETIKENGRLSSFIYYGNQEKENRIVLEKNTDIDINIQNTLYPNPIINKKNIHVIVLESFIDPRLLKEAQLNKNPLNPSLLPYLNKTGDFTHVISPVYGGGTSQIEFELLTGIKALAKVSSIEFNIMDGKPINSFVNRLEQHGYQSIATIATTPRFYNSKLAYNSLGFNTVLFLTEQNSQFHINKDDDRIFDGDVFNYNINKVKELLNNNQPIFNYVLGMYGHLPYKRNFDKRPDVLESAHDDKSIHRIANQFYYRTEAIAKYIKDLLAIDPNSIIYITSDHLPPLLNDKTHYEFNKLINISLFLNDGQNSDIPTKHHYEIPWLIWDILKGSKTKRIIQNEDMEKLYFKALSESI